MFFQSMAKNKFAYSFIVENIRSSRPEVFCKKDVLRNFAKFTGKHLCQSLFYNKVASLRPAIVHRTPVVAASETFSLSVSLSLSLYIYIFTSYLITFYLNIYIFQGFSFLHLEITLPFPKLGYAFEGKLFFSATINL